MNEKKDEWFPARGCKLKKEVQREEEEKKQLKKEKRTKRNIGTRRIHIPSLKNFGVFDKI